jgi:hypothetical protein
MNMNPITAFLMFALILAGLAIGYWVNPYVAFVSFVAAAIIALSLKMANAWEKAKKVRPGESRTEGTVCQ